MENQALILGYVNWAVIIFTVIGMFNYLSRKHKSILTLLGLSLFPAWILAAIMRGLIYLSNETTILFSPRGFVILMAEMLIPTIVFGGITFFFKYRKFKKEGLKQYEKEREAQNNLKRRDGDQYDDIIDEIGKNSEK